MGILICTCLYEITMYVGGRISLVSGIGLVTRKASSVIFSNHEGEFKRMKPEGQTPRLVDQVRAVLRHSFATQSLEGWTDGAGCCRPGDLTGRRSNRRVRGRDLQGAQVAE